MIPLSFPAIRSHRAPALYRRPSRARRAGVVALGAGGILALACGGNNSSEQGLSASDWVQTDGAAGRINLDDVQQAYRDSFSDGRFQVEKFEEAVNKIYEGDRLVLTQVEKKGETVEVSGWEDLNDNKQLDAETDDKLFTITQDLKENGASETRGYGANSYYQSSNPFGGFLPGLFLGYLLSGGRTTYITPPVRYDAIGGFRSSYRSSPDYQLQRDRNASYGSSVGSRFGSSATSRPVSPARSSYQSRQTNSGGFRSSGSTSRSIGSGSSGSSSGGGSKGGAPSSGGGGSSGSGGVSGGGGLMAL